MTHYAVFHEIQQRLKSLPLALKSVQAGADEFCFLRVVGRLSDLSLSLFRNPISPLEAQLSRLEVTLSESLFFPYVSVYLGSMSNCSIRK